MFGLFRKLLAASCIALLMTGTALIAAEKANVDGKKVKGILCDRDATIKTAVGVTRVKYPDADSVLVNDTEYCRYNPDGTSVTIDDCYEKILTEKGKRNYQTLTFWFMVPFSTVEIDCLEIIRPDGTIVPIDAEKNSKVMISPGQMSSNIYNPNNKIKTVLVPGLQVGDMLHYRYRRIALKTRVPDSWCEYFTLQSTSPIVRYRVVVDAPKELPLQSIVVKDEVKGSMTYKKSEKDGRIIYDWLAINVPRIFEEPGMPAYYTVVQRVLVSTFPDWKAISRWYWDISKSHLAKTTPAMKAKVEELVKGITDPVKKINAIFQFVSNDIRYMGITTEKEAPGYEPHDVNITFDNKYGVCRDKAALLAAMLRIAGFNAFPVLFYQGPKKDKEVPNNYFNHAITCVKMPDGKYMLMDSTDESTRDIFPSYLCDKSYLVATPEGETLLVSDVIPVKKNLVNIKTYGNIDANGTLTAKAEIQFNGINDSIYRGAFMRWKPEKRFNFFAGRIKRAVPGAELKSLRIFPDQLNNTKFKLRAELSFQVKNFPISGDNTKMMNLPWIGTQFGAVNFILSNTGLAKRRFPMKLFSTCGAAEKFRITMDDPGKVISIPEYKPINNPDMEWKQSVKVDKNVLVGTSEFLLKTMEISPKQYLVLKQSLKDIEYSRRKMPIFRSTGLLAGADAVILDKNIRFNVAADGSVTRIDKVKQQILTYGGKKEHSELKFRYNPSFETVKLKLATVTTPDGKVKKIKPEEINIMDAGWVGSAPRYPAEKVMVASLPGVDKGCVIDYEVERVTKKRPFVSLIGVFREMEPILKKTISISLDKNVADHLKTINADAVSYSESEENGRLVKSWSIANQKKIPDEIELPPFWLCGPSVYVSDGNWKEYAAKIKSVMDKAAEVSEKCVEVSRKLTTKAGSDAEKIRLIRDYIAENIRAAGPNFESLPLLAITPADRTLADAYGNSADRAIVYYAMLKAVGFKPEFVLTFGMPPVEEVMDNILGCPQLGFLGDVLVRINTPKGMKYLNCSSQYAVPGTCGENNYSAIMLNSGKIETVKVNSTLDNRFHAVFDMNVKSNGDTEIVKTVKYYGTDYEDFNQMYSEMTPEKRSRYFQREANNISAAAMLVSKKVDVKTYPAVKMVKVNVPRYAVKESKYLYFTLPLDMLKSLIRVGSDERFMPYYRSSFRKFKIKCNITLPKEYGQILMRPAGFKWSYPNDGGEITYSIKNDPENSNRLIAICSVDLKPSIVKPRRFSDLIFIADRLGKTATWLILSGTGK